MGLDSCGKAFEVSLFIAERLGEVGDWLEVPEIGAGFCRKGFLCFI